MNRRFKPLFAACLGAVAVAFLGAFGPDDDKTTKIKVGDEVPNFTLTDVKGKEHAFADLAGKTVVLEWCNPDCPYIRMVYGKGVVQETLDAMEKMGDDYVYVTVNSTANIPRDKVIEKNVKLHETHEVEVPILIDYDGAVGKMFDARTTPHMYVIDAKGVLRYSGAYTDDPRGKNEDRTNYVINALELMAKGETVSPDYVKPWGCSVKYAKK